PPSCVVGAPASPNLPPDISERAWLAGAGGGPRAVLVTLPAVRSALVVSAFLAFLISWSEYILTLLVGGGTVRTLPLLLFAAIGTADYTAAAALALVIAVPPLVLIGVTSRFLTGATPATVGFGRL
ncbi:MAG: ABC transporter permease subunit, partial [Pseudonocardia sp.]|nr:ABC transporter permease subunit [Pseudonocardia sp.]